MNSAAFFRIEGALTKKPTWAAAAWIAANAQGVGERMARMGNVALAAPFALSGELRSGDTATRLVWSGLRGMSEDRVTVLAREYYDEYLKESVTELGEELVDQARVRKQRLVLISDNVDLVVEPLAERLGADDLICNRLEFRNQKATGRLLDPVVGATVAGQWIRQFARECQVDLDASSAYGASAADSLLLSSIGRPCAVNPNRQLRRIASAHDWPVVQGS